MQSQVCNQKPRILGVALPSVHDKVRLSQGYIDVGDGCWRRTENVGDGYSHFGLQHPLSFDIGIGHQHSESVTNIEDQSPKSTNRHQL